MTIARGTQQEHDPNAAIPSHLDCRAALILIDALHRPANLLTGQLYVALDFVPHVAPGSSIRKQCRSRFPPHRGASMSCSSASRASSPKWMRSPSSILHRARTRVSQLDRLLAEDSPTGERFRQTLDEARHTLQSVRSLAELLDRHPEALIRGRSREATPLAGTASPAPRSP